MITAGKPVLLLDGKLIAECGITPQLCVEWVRESFLLKREAQLPPKSSLHPQGDDFFNTMPAMLPPRYGRMAVKEVRRIEGNRPALMSEIFLYDTATGQLLAVLDGDWITSMRTGAVAALVAREFKKSGAVAYGLMGLGNTARATMWCLLHSVIGETPTIVRLLRYKNQAQEFATRFSAYSQVQFEIVDTAEELVTQSDVLISCITSAKGLVCPHDNLFKPGMVVIPVHTRGFQNCDLFFDKVYGDDTGHVNGFKYFSRFKRFAEFDEVLRGDVAGRESDEERILCYNIGLGLHDALFASKIYDMLSSRDDLPSFTLPRESAKFYI